MGTLHANRADYETKSLSFTGLGATSNGPEEPGDARVTITLDVIESGLHDLGAYILGSTGPGFSGSVQHGHVSFDFAQARLTEPLSAPVYNGPRNMRIVFQTQRSFLKNLRRPIGPTAPDPSEGWFQQLLVLGSDKDLWRRRRIELEGQYAALDAKRSEVEAAEKDIGLRKDALFASGTDEWVSQARARGWQ